MAAAPPMTPEAIAELSVKELRRSVWARWAYRLSVIAGWAAVAGIWYLVARFVFSPDQLPYPHDVAVTAWEVLTERSFAVNLRSSILRVLAGFLLALVLSSGLSLLSAYSTWWRNLIHSLMGLTVSAPTVSFAVLSLVVLGISSTGPILSAMVVATPYLTTSITGGLTGVDRRLIVMSESFGRTRAQIISGILFPSSLLAILSGTRLAFAVVWRMVLLAEVFASAEGIGFQIRRSFETYDIPGMLAWALLFVAVMLLIENLVIKRIERRLSAWRTPDAVSAP